MTDVRRSLFLVSMERYTCAAITFLSLAVTSRLLSAREIGVAMLGAGIIGVLETLRECGASTFLIQHKNLMLENIRTAFTVMLGITFALIAIVWLAARPIALWFGSEAVEGYLHLAIVGLLYGPFISTVSALFRRDMAFGKLALIAIVCSIVQAATLIVLAIRGFGSMSFAWGGLSYGFCGTMMIFMLGADPSYFKPSLKGWRQSLSFAAYDSASALLNRAWEILPTFIFARTLGVDAVGLYSRATSVCQWPEKILFAGIGPVLLPAFAFRCPRWPLPQSSLSASTGVCDGASVARPGDAHPSGAPNRPARARREMVRNRAAGATHLGRNAAVVSRISDLSFTGGGGRYP